MTIFHEEFCTDSEVGFPALATEICSDCKVQSKTCGVLHVVAYRCFSEKTPERRLQRSL